MGKTSKVKANGKVGVYFLLIEGEYNPALAGKVPNMLAGAQLEPMPSADKGLGFKASLQNVDVDGATFKGRVHCGASLFIAGSRALPADHPMRQAFATLAPQTAVKVKGGNVESAEETLARIFKA